MVDRIFGRVATLEVVPPLLPGIRIETRASRGLRFQFSVLKTMDPAPSTASMTVYNLAKSTRELITGVSSRTIDISNVNGLDGLTPAQRVLAGIGRPAVQITHASGGAYVRLSAGYERGNRASQIFEGATTTADNRWSGSTWTTTLTCGDGQAGTDSGIACRAFESGTPLLVVVRYLRRTMGLGVGNSEFAITLPSVSGDRNTFPDGFVAVGKAADILTELFKLQDIDWFVDDGDLFIRDGRGEVPTANPGVFVPVVLDVGHGLLERPRRLEDGRYELVSLLNPNLRLAGRAIVLSGEAAGNYRIEQVMHSGDTHGGDFRTVAEVRSIATIPGVF